MWGESIASSESSDVIIHKGPSAAKLKKTMNSDLSDFQLVPPNMEGETLLNHQIKFREMNSRTNNNNPSKYLDVAVTSDNLAVLNFTRDLICGKNLPAKRIIFADSFGTGAKKNSLSIKSMPLGELSLTALS